MTALFAAIATAALGQSSPTIESYINTNFKDVSFVAQVQNAKQAELRKINKDFADSYRFKSSQVWMKEPLMLRMEGKVEDTSIFFIVNGTKRLVRVPRANINQKEDLSRSPGKRQTPLDFGLLTPSLFKDFFQSKFVRSETRGDFAGCQVFDLTYIPRLDDTSRHRVWVDSQMKFVRKREWYSQNGGKLLAIFTYDKPQQVSGVYVPTRVTVMNSEGKVGGSTTYGSLKVNTGLPNSLFEIK
ncbi:MAG: outer membrane lipoprotein-sorting protein [Fimbriimonadaceae bacterium]|nr:outer membrane lipoprotein-sorting protein [Fimbriimonadaceae bacterium]QYK55042.1 MAG: outer membrane lipoprotein-sorting protein [Fimbriimonadaceae bacterium]